MKKYKKSNVSTARTLRKNQTPHERKLWYMFLKAYPICFQRQKPISGYIVDFYCAKAGLVVEVDGGEHYEPEAERYDELRTKKLEVEGLKVIRVTNREVDGEFEAVCDYIDNTVRSLIAVLH